MTYYRSWSLDQKSTHRRRDSYEGNGNMKGTVAAFVLGGLLATGFVTRVDAGCIESRLCCPDRDETCGAYELDENGGALNRCFCDTACLMTKDCCSDYTDYCTPVDCIVEERWRQWNKCDTRCGTGVRNRTRLILQYPRNGGKECDSTIQFGVCIGNQCKVPRSAGAQQPIREIGYILPLSAARWRNDVTYTMQSHLRRNPINRKRRSHERYSDSYCATYRLNEVSLMCGHDSSVQNQQTGWSADLASGLVVCVECQPIAKVAGWGERCRGHGVMDRETRWAAMTVSGCRGKWTMITKAKPCHCQVEYPLKKSFIFV